MMAVPVLSAEEIRRERARIWATVPRKGTGVEVVLLSVFGDESADGKQARVFAVAGVVGNEPEWQDAESLWLERTGGEVIHATDCEHEKRFDLYNDLTQIIAKSRLRVFGSALDLMAVKEFFPGHLDIGYFHCFVRVVEWMVDNEANRLNEAIEFTFHNRKGTEYNAGKLYDVLINTPGWEASIFMRNKISFANQESPRIQMADLVARETMKALDHDLQGKPQRDSMLAIFGREKRGIIRVFGRDQLSELRDFTDGEISTSLHGDYISWLNKNSRRDNISNRTLFMEVINNLILNPEKTP